VLEDVKPSGKEIKINGIGGYQMTVRGKGHLPNSFEVYCSPKVKVNVLCFAEVEDLFLVENKEREGFTVHLPDGKEIFFERQNKMFVAKVEQVAAVLMTITEKKLQYSNAEVKRAEAAYELLKNAGYPSAAELIYLLGDGNVLDMPALTRSDNVRAYDIFGQPPEYVRGTLTMKKVNRVTFDAALRSEDAQTLWSDVMHIDRNSFFVSVAEPMQLVMLNHIKSEDAKSLGEALQDQLNLLRERNFQPQLVDVASEWVDEPTYAVPRSGNRHMRSWRLCVKDRRTNTSSQGYVPCGEGWVTTAGTT
jgi:hypothetical protein